MTLRLWDQGVVYYPTISGKTRILVTKIFCCNQSFTSKLPYTQKVSILSLQIVPSVQSRLIVLELAFLHFNFKTHMYINDHVLKYVYHVEFYITRYSILLYGFCCLSLSVANLGNRAVYYIRQSWLIETHSPPASSNGARPNGESKYRVGPELYFCFIRSIHFNLYILWVSFSFLTILNI